MIELHVKIVVNSDEPIVLVDNGSEIGEKLEIGGKFGIKGLNFRTEIPVRNRLPFLERERAILISEFGLLKF